MQTDTLECEIRFRTGDAVVDLAFDSNKQRIEAFLKAINSIECDSLAQIESIYIEGSASPEGGNAYNKQLSEQRALAVKNYLNKHIAIEPNKLTVRGIGVDYDLLAQMVDTCGQPWASQMSEILRNTPLCIYDQNGNIVDGKKKQMMELESGNPYRWMFKHLFPAMQRGISVVECTIVRQIPAPVTNEPINAESIDIVDADGLDLEQDSFYPPTADIVENEEMPTSEPKKPSRPIALHNNFIYDALAIPNLGIEVALSHRFSIATNWHYAWWQNDKKHRHWKTYGGFLALRYHFGKDDSAMDAWITPFRGHHLGVYGQILLYNFEWGGRGYMSGLEFKNIFHHPTVAAGIEYGYTLPLARRFSLDFTIGVGYMQGQYYEYLPIDTHYVWQATKQRHFFGPTKLEVNLVWLIGRGNVNHKKGGAE